MRVVAVLRWPLGSLIGATAAAGTAARSLSETLAFLRLSSYSALPHYSAGLLAMPHAGNAGDFLLHKGSCSTCEPMQPHVLLNLHHLSLIHI